MQAHLLKSLASRRLLPQTLSLYSTPFKNFVTVDSEAPVILFNASSAHNEENLAESLIEFDLGESKPLTRQGTPKIPQRNSRAIEETEPQKSQKMPLFKYHIQEMIKVKEIKSDSVHEQLEEQFKVIMITIAKYKGLRPRSKTAARKPLIDSFEYDYPKLTEYLQQIIENDWNHPTTKDIIHMVFNFLSFAFTQNLHSEYLFDTIGKQVFTFPIITASRIEKNLPVFKLYARKYGDDASDEVMKQVTQYFKEHSSEIFEKAQMDAFIYLTDGFTAQTIEDQGLRRILHEETRKRFDAGEFNSENLMKIFVLCCRGGLFVGQQDLLLKKFEVALKADLDNMSSKALSRAFTCLSKIAKYSVELHTAFLDHIILHKDIIDEAFLGTLIKQFDQLHLSETFVQGIVQHIQNTHAQGTFSVWALVHFSAILARKKHLSYKFFSPIEKYIVENFDTHYWTSKDLNTLFWTCRRLNIDDSPVFKRAEPNVYKVLNNPRLTIQDFIFLLSELPYANHLTNFEIFKTILNRIQENFDNLIGGENIIWLPQIGYALSLFIAKYCLFDEKNYKEIYRQQIINELHLILPKIEQLLGEVSVYDQDMGFKFRLFQFIFTLFIEFPEIITKYPIMMQLTQNFKNYSVEGQGVSNYAVENVELLKRAFEELGVEYETFQKIYIYSIQVLIKPNIALQINHPSKYTRETGNESHQHIMKNYHLIKLGYRVASLPAVELHQVSQQGIEKLKEYLRQHLPLGK